MAKTEKTTDETISELRARLDEMEKALELKPTDEDMQRLRAKLEAVTALVEHGEAIPVPGFEMLQGTRPAWKPTIEGGALMLNFTPEMGTHAIVTKDKSKKLPTGVKFIIPDGFIAFVAQRRSNGTAQVFDCVRRYAAGTTSEIEITCTADERDGVGRRINPGDVIGCAWLEQADWLKKNEVKA